MNWVFSLVPLAAWEWCSFLSGLLKAAALEENNMQSRVK